MAAGKVNYEPSGMTKRQEAWIKAFNSVCDVYEAARISGIAKGNIMKLIRRETTFGKKARETIRKCNEISDIDPRFNKQGSLMWLMNKRSEVEASEDIDPVNKYRILLDIQKEINKMVDGNLAKKDKQIGKVVNNYLGVIDLTKGSQTQLPEAIEDADFKVIENEPDV